MWNKKLPTGIVRVVDLAATVQLAAHDASAWRQRAVHLPSFDKKNPLDDLELSSLLFFFLNILYYSLPRAIVRTKNNSELGNDRTSLFFPN